ncbi:NAD(P)/FAD-dependent oxidoreductase [Chitinophaga nivalis]|uniref:NAD(P)/FAD-dependent oxidoreductase n=1 Tax=Chitinophaga nivalis TaxID=2991709 RepID=A0ABT3IPP6_9BACT|nr:NAD(P)/FAD-dependent oxidoreductase [Chitinophaga nivalis]MCW3464366.1 NAD(P)/FAD-dependent oxidoreductase [Chitinophaga nivalis]MCW3485943.1 NAD(P)/FAD-dependent oxidoreductase [Chitinophaga nivalis]
MITRRNFLVRNSLLSAALAVPGVLMSFAKPEENADHTFDVIIVGGSYAGLAAAMALGRSLRKVLIIDSGLPCNRQTPHSHNFLTQDGVPPKEIAAKGREQVQHYDTVSFYESVAVQAKKKGEIFELTTQSGRVFSARKLLFATGLKDLMPPIPGFAECWGISILHCPYCHGYEVKGLATGIWANGDMAVHYAPLVANLTKQVFIFTDGAATFSEDQAQLIRKNNIHIVEQQVKALIHDNGQLSGIHLQDGAVYPIRALYARPAFEQHCKIPLEMGCALTEQGLLKLDNFQQTTIPGVYACGDNSAMRAVATAVATGTGAGAAINLALSTADFNLKK